MDGNANLPNDQERSMLRDAIRTLLEQHWPSDKAKAFAAEPAAVARLWRVLAEQGCTVLGADPESGGLREILAVMAELGRAACPAPMLDAAIVNTLLAEAATGNAGVARFLGALHAGQAYACVSFGAFDPDRGVGGVTVSDGRVSGTVAFVDAAAPATHFVIFDASAPSEGPSVAIVERTAEKVRLTPTRAMGMDGLCKVAFAEAPAVIVPMLAERVGDLLSLSRLCYAARAWGAADRAFELVVQYVKMRQQFGQPVGRFQAIQHKLANNLIALMGVQACLDNAASHYDRGIAEWRTFAAASFAYAHATLRQVALETHHSFGAIGYAEDHEAPRHFKRIHLDMVRHGGGRRAREELA
ncbi:MAG TPA: acyl-CoA dehydrogenase family protein, partial [Reyranella sp.]